MNRPAILVWAVAVTLGATPAAAAPIQWSVTAGGNDHYYELILPASPAGNFTWFQARDAAAASTFLGSSGHLATITSVAESEFLRLAFQGQMAADNFTGSFGDFAWLGLTDQLVEGDYRWITGEPFGYSNWAPPEPNNLGDEDYVHLWRRDYGDGAGPRWSWNDSDPGPVVARWDQARFGYLVEYPGPFAMAVPEPSSVVLLGLGGLASLILGRARRRGSAKSSQL